MARQRIIKRLAGYFRKNFRRRLKKQESIRSMVGRMTEKEIKLKKRLKSEKSKSARTLLKDKLRVLEAQREKAKKLLDSDTSQ